METREYEKGLQGLYNIIKRLRDPDGCPWDQKQTPETIKKYLLEEAHELAEAISEDDRQHTREELGDLFFILLLIVRIYEEDKSFTLEDVFSGITEKMIRRHPHVFEGIKTGSDTELKKQWEAIKSLEKKS